MSLSQRLDTFSSRFPRLYWLGPAAGWAAAIFWLSSQGGDDLPKVSIPHLDKAAHFVLYGGLGWFCARAAGREGPLSIRAAILAWAAASLYGLSDEAHQLFTASRSFEWADWLFDMLGAAAGTAGWALWRRAGGRLLWRA